MEQANEYGKSRLSYLGGSCISTVVGVNEYKTLLELYEDKLGLNPKTESNSHMKIGLALEPMVLQNVADKVGLPLIKPYFLQHPVYDFLGGSPDALIGDCIIEAKTTASHKIKESEEIPATYYTQIQYYLGLSGKKKCYLGVQCLAGAKDFFIKEIEFDKNYYEFLVSEGVNFWNDHIIPQIPPAPSSVGDLNNKFPVASPDSSVQADETIINALLELKNIKSQESVITKRKEELDFIVKEAFSDKESLVCNGVTLATYKTSYSTRINSKKLKEEYIEIYKICTNKTSGRRLLLVNKNL